ncbi:N-acetyltransferase [Neiella marina]|uniref:N-acetyltransferase n=1 Tax=Neiella marina TaxID=508461 RepID=A0A8J2U327_9GAMM|nr:GNAT family N-acetyltransferase [Neiella marina]GGA69761.1 N-acetyltransferase [Neiella marina]
MKIELATMPAHADLETISQGIQSYNQLHLPDEVVFEPDTKFAVFVRNNHNEVVGGVRATAFWNYCIVELLWLSEETRGSGVGSKLMAQVESYAKSKGFQYIRAETLDFQAKGFYEKLGYKVFGQLPDYPKGHTTYCLAKDL